MSVKHKALSLEEKKLLMNMKRIKFSQKINCVIKVKKTQVYDILKKPNEN
jgi:hypothetical protein